MMNRDSGDSMIPGDDTDSPSKLKPIPDYPDRPLADQMSDSAEIKSTHGPVGYDGNIHPAEEQHPSKTQEVEEHV